MTCSPPPARSPVCRARSELSADDVTCAVDARGGVACFDPLQLLGPATAAPDHMATFSSDRPAVEIAVGALGVCARHIDDSIDCLTWQAPTLTRVENLPP